MIETEEIYFVDDGCRWDKKRPQLCNLISMHGLSRARGGEYHLFAQESCNVFVVVDITFDPAVVAWR